MNYKEFKRKSKLDKVNDEISAYSEIYDFLIAIKNNGHFEYKKEPNSELLVET